jgi:hypothetical protein
MRRLPGVAIAIGLLGCAPLQRRESAVIQSVCAFTVANQTPYAMAVRMAVSRYSTMEIGALNPGELLHHQAACAQRTVFIQASAIPSQVGAPTPHGYLRRWADLSEGENVMIALSWP